MVITFLTRGKNHTKQFSITYYNRLLIQLTLKKAIHHAHQRLFMLATKAAVIMTATAKKSHVKRKLYQTAKRECINYVAEFMERN